MVLIALILSVLLPGSKVALAGDEPAWRGPWKGVPELVALLDSVPEGKAVLAQAAAKDPDFRKRIHLGEASFTESTFARTYSLLDGKEQIEHKHDITLNKKLPLSDAVVDLAHELIHFTEKEMLDPYRPGFKLGDFIRRGIEGQGWELDALEQECLVAWALKAKYPGFPQHRLCLPYRKAKGGFARSQALRDYFALGNWYGNASDELLKAVPELSRKAVVFTSSYARKPYPIALAEEYEATREAACANNQKKYRLISAQAESGRAPAADQLNRERVRLKTWNRLYCSSVGQKPKNSNTR